jgi:hypothetical protein
MVWTMTVDIYRHFISSPYNATCNGSTYIEDGVDTFRYFISSPNNATCNDSTLKMVSTLTVTLFLVLTMLPPRNWLSSS